MIHKCMTYPTVNYCFRLILTVVEIMLAATFIIFHVKQQIPLIVTAISEMFWERNCRARAMSNSTV